jgi:excisionase family DNA binding protein
MLYQSMAKEVLTTKEAAEFLGLSIFTVCKYAKAGIIPAKKVGRDWRFYLPTLIAWLKSGQGITTPNES